VGVEFVKVTEIFTPIALCKFTSDCFVSTASEAGEVMPKLTAVVSELNVKLLGFVMDVLSAAFFATVATADVYEP
jgi:hypothetical protein